MTKNTLTLTIDNLSIYPPDEEGDMLLSIERDGQTAFKYLTISEAKKIIKYFQIACKKKSNKKNKI